jgi:hypothetical protein
MNTIEFKVSEKIGLLTLSGELNQNRENVLREALMVPVSSDTGCREGKGPDHE